MCVLLFFAAMQCQRVILLYLYIYVSYHIAYFSCLSSFAFISRCCYDEFSSFYERRTGECVSAFVRRYRTLETVCACVCVRVRFHYCGLFHLMLTCFCLHAGKAFFPIDCLLRVSPCHKASSHSHQPYIVYLAQNTHTHTHTHTLIVLQIPSYQRVHQHEISLYGGDIDAMSTVAQCRFHCVAEGRARNYISQVRDQVRT